VSGFLVKKENGELAINDFGGYETRNSSTISLLRRAIETHEVGDFPQFGVHTGDKAWSFPGEVTLSYSTPTEDFKYCCPDFVFDHWKQVGMDDYESTRILLRSIDQPPETNKLGWRGANQPTPYREIFVNQCRSLDPEKIDVEFIHWDRTNPDRLSANNFLSFEGQVRKWRFLVDIEGAGYSGRLKLLLCSNRLVFIQDRPDKEWFFENLQPWKHYVPLNRDCSNLDENLDKILASPDLEETIIANARQFSDQNLTRDAALKRWAEICRWRSEAA